MNIFILHKNPISAAEMLCDEHVCSQMNESLSMLSTVIRWKFPDTEFPDLYKEAHPHHPATLWTNRSFENWVWLLAHATEIWNQYQIRYGRKHRKFDGVLARVDNRKFVMADAEWDEEGLTPFALVMPEEYRSDDPVDAYRGFYAGEKDFATWRNGPPKWWLKSMRG